MALTTFSELKTAIADYYARDDFGTPDDDFVTLTEARIQYGSANPNYPSAPLRTRQMLERATASTAGEFLALPTDFLEIIHLKVTANPARSLRFVSPTDFDQLIDTTLTGTPRFYTILNEEFRFSPYSTGETVEILYYEKIPALSDTNTSNWLLADAPNVYLLGGLLEASIWLQADNDIVRHGQAFAGAVNSLNMADRKSSYGKRLRQRSGNLPPSNSSAGIFA